MDIEQLQKENYELKANINQLRDVIISATNNGIQLDGGKWVYSIDDSVLSAIPAQSLNHILSKVEEETIERCAKELFDGEIGKKLRKMPRKHKEQSNED